MNTKPSVLLIGPLPNAGDAVDGAKVSFAAMAKQLGEEPSLETQVFDTSRKRRDQGPIRRFAGELGVLASVLFRIAAGGKRPEVVVFNTSSAGLLMSTPLIRLACGLRCAKLIVRVSGGDLDLQLERSKPPTKWFFARFLARVDLLLLQTGALCSAFGSKDGTGNVRWWPTTRDLLAMGPPKVGSHRRFLFVGQMRREKGVMEAIEAARSLPAGATLTLVGPRMPGLELEERKLPSSCTYRGELLPQQIPAVLERHDVLVLPTYDEGEGLPGIVIEAMQTGLPVISTHWRSVPEIVHDGVNGLLVQPRDAEELGRAMRKLAGNDAILSKLRQGALQTGDGYRSTAWERYLVSYIHEVAGSTHEVDTDVEDDLRASA